MSHFDKENSQISKEIDIFDRNFLPNIYVSVIL